MNNSERNHSTAFKDIIDASIDVKRQLTFEHISCLNEIVNLLKRCLAEGNKILLFGNGGSAADSQHIAAELVSKFNKERKALSAIALTTDTSILTAISNDYAFDNVFARQIEALGQKGDVAIGISTSGNSPNVLKGLAVAREKGLSTVGLTGQNGGKLKDYVDLCFNAPTDSTPRIQEVHITVAHALCDILEQELC